MRILELSASIYCFAGNFAYHCRSIFAIYSAFRRLAFMSFPHLHLISARDLSADDILTIFERSDDYLRFLRSSDRKRNDLNGVSVVLAFFENSTRTRVSFELAAKRLSAEVTAFQSAASSVAKGETLLDTILNIETMKVDILIMRHHHSGAHEFLASRQGRVQSSIVNAGDGQHEHPTQGLLDAFTLYQKFGSSPSALKGLRYCLVGDILHSRVARSNIPIFQALGAEVAVCGPGTLMPNLDAFGVKIFSHIDEAVEWADALNVLRIQHERMQQGLIPTLREFTHFFALKRRHIEQKPELAILHPGPINRGVELEAEVADAAQSLILSQVERGVAVRMAVLALLSESRARVKA
jgi:aspartate carbamoyltransferase catalytic subunit